MLYLSLNKGNDAKLGEGNICMIKGLFFSFLFLIASFIKTKAAHGQLNISPPYSWFNSLLFKSNTFTVLTLLTCCIFSCSPKSETSCCQSKPKRKRCCLVPHQGVGSSLCMQPLKLILVGENRRVETDVVLCILCSQY